jgi:Domain of unknown function (DUF4926)
MQDIRPKLLDTVALLEDRPGTSLKAGQVGTVVEFLGSETSAGPEACEVEFCDGQGRTLDLVALRRREFLVLLPTSEALAV